MNPSSQDSSRYDRLVADLKARIRVLQDQVRRQHRLAMLGTLAAMVAHEFNNLLTPVLYYAQLARDGDPQMQTKAVRFALQAAGQAAAISRAILDITGSAGEAPCTVALADLVHDALTLMARDLGKDGVRLVRRIPPGVKVRTRPAELKQVLLNLLLNARSAAMKKGAGQTILVAARRCGDRVYVSVADTGMGVRRQDLAHIFDPFFTTGNGAGLGLAVCRRIVAGLNGRLVVRSQVGKGACFTIVLPLRCAREHRLGARRASHAAAG